MSAFRERVEKALEGRYTIERRLGSGGMSLVFLAQDPKLDRLVAVKVLRPELTAAVGADRFLQEIRVTARLQHPHILPLHDSGEAEGILFYAMPYVEGESLAERIRREGQLGLEDSVNIAREVADGLSHAHANGVVHRDIKPENILLSAGHAVIADFGVARAVTAAGDSQITTTGMAIGTPAYMSPEQAAGESNVDGRSDVYSLGCVLYEMLAGCPPFTGPNAQAIIARKSMEAAPRLSVLRDTVPTHIEMAIFRALARAPADRFATAQQFGEALLAPAEGTQFSMSSIQRAVGPAPERSIAVLPFVNMSADAENEYLSDGISDELIHALAKVDGLHVAARTSSFAFKGKQEDVRTIGDRLNVRSVLEGSVRRAANRLRVTAQLVNADDGYELWSGRFEREIVDVFTVQDEIAHAILSALELEWLGEARPSGPAAPFEAYELYLKGRHAWSRRTEDGLHQSIELLQQALAVDEQYAAAHAGLAESYITLAIYGAAAPTDVLPQAVIAADRALALDGSLGEAVAARGCVRAMFDWDWSDAERDFKTALDLSPQYPTARQWYAINCLAPQGRFEEARAELVQAYRLDPLSLAINISVGLLALFERDYPRAIKEYRRVLATDSTNGTAFYFLGQALTASGEYTEAVRALERARDLRGDAPEVMAALGSALAGADRRDDAERILRDLTDGMGDRYVSSALRAPLQYILGDRDGAFEAFERAIEDHATELTWLRVRPAFDVCRDDVRFAELLQRVDLAETASAVE